MKETKELGVWKNLDLADTFEGISLGTGLVDTVSELGGSIDELEVDLFKITTTLGYSHALTESEDSLLDSWTRSLDHDEVLVDETVCWSIKEESGINREETKRR